MFTGIVSDIGIVAAVAEENGIKRVRIDCRYVPGTIAIGGIDRCRRRLPDCRVIAAARGRRLVRGRSGAGDIAVTTAEGWKVGTRGEPRTVA